jgi:molybdopterin/thiamine biosynthesis adenylyltransferase
MTYQNNLNPIEQQRYKKQTQIKAFGNEAQHALASSKVLVIGVGGLGSPVLYYLVAAGIGTVGLCDFDVVELSNLNRQILHYSNDIKKDKTQSAYDKLKALNPHVNLVQHNLKVNHSNIKSLLEDYDVVVDAVDNLATRLFITDACYLLRKPCIEGAVAGFHGTLTTIIPKIGPCFRCLYLRVNSKHEYQVNPDEGVLGAIAGIIGSLQANETIKLCSNIMKPHIGKLLIFDGLNCEFEYIDYSKNPQCPLCGKDNIILEIEDCGKQF